MPRPKGSKNGKIVGPRKKDGSLYKDPTRTGKRCRYGHINCVEGEACEEIRTRMGQPTKWKPEYNHAIVEHFSVESFKTHFDEHGKPYNIVAAKFPTFEGFANDVLKTSVQTLHTWAKEENASKYPGFREAFTRAHELQKKIYIENGASGASNGGVVQMLGKNMFDFKDTQDLTNAGGKFEAPIIVDSSGEPFKLGK